MHKLHKKDFPVSLLATLHLRELHRSWFIQFAFAFKQIRSSHKVQVFFTELRRKEREAEGERTVIASRSDCHAVTLFTAS